MKRLTIELQQTEQFYQEIIEILRQGGVIAIPTDTVYGLAIDADNAAAAKKLVACKRRAEDKPLALFLDRRDRIKDFAFVKNRKIIEFFMPGPLTIVFWAKPGSPAQAADKSIGIRIPQVPWILELVRRYGKPLAVTSANLADDEPIVSPQHIAEAMPAIDLIVDGGPRVGLPSTVLDLRSNFPTILRKGKISFLEIEKAINRLIKLGPTATFNVLFVCTGNSCRSSMAQGILRGFISDPRLVIDSCGTAAGVGDHATEHAQQVVKMFGWDISSHRTKPLAKDLINQADLILCMEFKHFEKVLELGPSAAIKTFLLKEYKRGQVMNNEVPDPIGQDLKAYQNTAKAMLPSLKVLQRELEIRLDP